MDLASLPVDFDNLDKRREYSFKKFDIVVRYAQTTDCKRNYILKYFHDDETSSCYEKYVEKNNLFWCNKCFKHSLKQNNFTIMDSKYYCKTCEM